MDLITKIQTENAASFAEISVFGHDDFCYDEIKTNKLLDAKLKKKVSHQHKTQQSVEFKKCWGKCEHHKSHR